MNIKSVVTVESDLNSIASILHSGRLYGIFSSPARQCLVSFLFKPSRKSVPLIAIIAALAGAATLLAWDACPARFPARSHDYLSTFALTLTAVALLLYRAVKWSGPLDFGKTLLLAAAFLFWAANQFWPDSPRATLFNDIAIGLFVLDVFFLIAARPVGN